MSKRKEEPGIQSENICTVLIGGVEGSCSSMIISYLFILCVCIFFISYREREREALLYGKWR